MSYDHCSKAPCITIMHGKSITVLEMEHQIIDFIVLCNSIWPYGEYYWSSAMLTYFSCVIALP